MLQTKIYYADTDVLADSVLYERCYSLMPLSRQSRIDRYRNISDRLSGVGAFALLCAALSDIGYRSVPEIITGEHGKPYFADLPGLHFNLSHSATRAMCIISEHECGCDVEFMRSTTYDISARFFSETESEYCSSLPPSEFGREFYRIWTLKESYIKAQGGGLSVPLRGFSVIDRDGTILSVGDAYPGYLGCLDGFAMSYCIFGSEEIPESTEIVLGKENNISLNH